MVYAYVYIEEEVTQLLLLYWSLRMHCKTHLIFTRNIAISYVCVLYISTNCIPLTAVQIEFFFITCFDVFVTFSWSLCMGEATITNQTNAHVRCLVIPKIYVSFDIFTFCSNFQILDINDIIVFLSCNRFLKNFIFRNDRKRNNKSCLLVY